MTYRCKPAVACITACMVFLSSCGLYNKEYVSVSDYSQESRQDTMDSEIISVSDSSQLEMAVISIIEHYEDSNVIVFDSGYNGDPTSDLSSVCRQIVQRNPLCAYCVENITFDIYKVPAYYEAKINVHFAEQSIGIGEIIRLNYGGEIKSVLSKAMKNGDKKIAVLVNRSTLSADDIIKESESIYYSSPLSFPSEPSVSVNIYSDNGNKRLYEISIDYGVSDEQYNLFKDSTGSFSFQAGDTAELNELEKVSLAVSYLLSNCTVSENSSDNTAFSALIQGKADSEGLSLAMISLCSTLNIDCKIVKGQHEWKNHYWNIVRIDGSYYHIDMERCITEDASKGFLLNDDSMWNSYRWDLSGYPQCNGPLTYRSEMLEDLTSGREDIPEEIFKDELDN